MGVGLGDGVPRTLFKTCLKHENLRERYPNYRYFLVVA